MVKIKDLAKVRSGTSFSKKPEFCENGDFYMLEGAAVSEAGEINVGKLIKASRSQPKIVLPAAPVENGDVLVRSKGSKLTAFVFSVDSNITEVYPNSFFHIISILDRNQITPEFLACAINSLSVQQFLQTNSRGSAIKHIPKTLTESIEVNVPSIEKQNLIVKTEQLLRAEEQLLAELREQQVKYMNVTIQQLIDGVQS